MGGKQHHKLEKMAGNGIFKKRRRKRFKNTKAKRTNFSIFLEEEKHRPTKLNWKY